MQRGEIARKQAEGMRIEKILGLDGTAEEAEAIAKFHVVQRGKIHVARKHAAEF